MCPKYFALIDDNSGINIYTYDGKQVQSPNITEDRIAGLSKKMICLSNDIIAVLPPDRTWGELYILYWLPDAATLLRREQNGKILHLQTLRQFDRHGSGFWRESSVLWRRYG
jgi:hypothetical protein